MGCCIKEVLQRTQVIELGGLAEWSKAAVLKTVEPRGSVGSNPTPTAIFCINSSMKNFKTHIAEEVKREQELNGKKFSVSYHVEPTPSQKRHIKNIFVPYAIMYTKDGYDVTIRSSRHMGLESRFVLFRTKGGKSQPMIDKLISTHGKIKDA